MNRPRLLTFFAFIFFVASLYVSAQTLEDIRRKLNKKEVSQQSHKKDVKFEIRSVRPGNLSGWEIKNDNGVDSALSAVYVVFKINEKGASLPVPYNYCYFFDKDRNLLDKKKANHIFPGGNARGQQIEADLLQVKGRSPIQIAFVYPQSFKYKYALVVIGDENSQSVACYPKSEDPMSFEFDEKQLFAGK